jgi:hypothetical protein
MKAAPHASSPRKQLWVAREMASLERASTSRADQELMTKIKKARITRKDVKNEDRPGDMYENKGANDKMSGYYADFLADNSQNAR